MSSWGLGMFLSMARKHCVALLESFRYSRFAKDSWRGQWPHTHLPEVHTPGKCLRGKSPRSIYLSHGWATSMPNVLHKGLRHQGLRALSYKASGPFSTGSTIHAATWDKTEVQAPCPAAGRGCPSPLAVLRMSTGLGDTDRWLEKFLTLLPRGR